MRALRLALLWLVVACGGAVGARTEGQAEYTVRAWLTEDGLPQSSVKSMVQTPDGYLWLATFNGLARFDGVRFTVFDTANVPGLPGNRLTRLFVDRAGALWMITEQLALARLQAGSCRAFTVADGLPPEGVGWVAEVDQGDLWLAGAKEGLSRWRDGKFVALPVPPESAGKPWEAMSADGAGGTWLLQADRAFVWQHGQFSSLTRPEGQPETVVKRSCPSRDGGLWVFTPAELRRWRQGKWLPEVWSCPDFKNGITDAREDLVGNLWVATYNHGLFRFNPTEGWQHFTVADGLTTLSLRSLLCDREGNVWVGTDGGGLLRVRPRLWKLITRREGLGIDAVHSVTQDEQGRIWFAGGTTKPYWLDQGAVAVAIPSPLSDTMEGVWAVRGGRRGAMWIGTYWGKVFRYQQGALTVFGKDEGMLAGSVRALLEDRQGTLWVGGYDGLSQIDGTRVTHYSRREGLSSARVWALAEDSRGSLYIGTADGGLNRRQDGRFTAYTRAQGLPDDAINSLYVDSEDVLWIGTRGGGLSRLQAERFFNYRVKGGLQARSVGPLLEDYAGYLWLTSDLGIVRVSRRELNDFAAGRSRGINYVAFDQSDGLATLEVGGIQPACLSARDGKLWFGTAKGAAFVDPRELRSNPLPPPVLIEEVRIDDAVVERPGSLEGRHPSLADPSPVILHPDQRRIEFRFTGLSFTAPAKVRFRYQMEGFDPDWVDGDTTRSASYTRLWPGTYRFRVTACNNDGVWDVTGASLGVVVQPAWHQTWWFRSLVIAAAAGAVAGVFQLRLSRLRQLSRLRERIAGDLHDEIGSNLGGIILVSELAQRAPSLPPEAQISLQEINATAQRTASAMRDIVWFLNPDFDTLADMAVRMREFAATLLVGIECKFIVPVLPRTPSLPLEFRRNVFFAFKEILHNVVKHAGARRVSIQCELTGRQFTLRVQDDGCGFDATVEVTGHGLRSLRQRAAALGGQLLLQSQPGKGTCVALTVKLP